MVRAYQFASGLFIAFFLAVAFAITAFAQVEIIRVHPNDALTQARQALADGRAEDSIRYSMRILDQAKRPRPAHSIEPLKLDAHLILCVAHRIERQWEVAIDHCNRAISMRPGDWRGYTNRGVIAYERRQYAKAIADFEKADRLHPNHWVIERNLRLSRKALSDR